MPDLSFQLLMLLWMLSFTHDGRTLSYIQPMWGECFTLCVVKIVKKIGYEMNKVIKEWRFEKNSYALLVLLEAVAHLFLKEDLYERINNSKGCKESQAQPWL